MSLSVADLTPRCGHCNKLLAEKVTRPWAIRCGRCKTVNFTPEPGDPQDIVVEADHVA